MEKFIRMGAEVEAFQWNGERPLPKPLIPNWNNNPMTPDSVSVYSRYGYLPVEIGDWVVKGTHGRHYPIKPDEFKTNYKAI